MSIVQRATQDGHRFGDERRTMLKAAVDVLRSGRESLVADFLREDPAIYGPAFEHERFPETMKLCIEHYMGGWVTRHWRITLARKRAQLPIHLAAEQAPLLSAEEQAFFDAVIQQLARARLSWMNGVEIPSALRQLIDIQLKQTAELLKVATHATMSERALEAAIAKERALFERLFENEVRKQGFKDGLY